MELGRREGRLEQQIISTGNFRKLFFKNQRRVLCIVYVKPHVLSSFRLVFI